MTEPTSCKAIIKYEDKFLVYLRDDKPSIPFAGYWDFFGGVIEENETPVVCMKREIEEELSIKTEPKFIEVLAEETHPVRYVAIFFIELTAEQYHGIKFTGEGQDYRLLSGKDLVDMRLVPHFRKYLQ